MASTHTRPVEAVSAHVLFARTAGVTYLVAGLMAWLVTDVFVGESPANLLGFHVNGLHNVVHLGLAAAWLVASASAYWARRVNVVAGGALLLLAAVGLVGGLEGVLNVRAGLDADNLLHLGTGGLAVWLARFDPGP